jgi:hypothetical protein
MHHSRFCALVIDCQDANMEQATAFWSQAFGRPMKPSSPDDPNYRELTMGNDEPLVLVQRVSHPSRVHLDIETDNLEAEVARLEKLGARRVEFVKRWWVMEAPTGQRFCVVNPQRGSLEGRANVWP